MIGYLAAQRMAKKKPAGGDLNIAQQKVDSDIPEIKSNFLSGSAPVAPPAPVASAPTRPVAPPTTYDEWNPSLQAFPQYKRIVTGYDNEGNEQAGFEITGYTDQSGNKVDNNLVKPSYRDSGENTTMGYMFSGAPTAPPAPPAPAPDDMGAKFTALESATNERFASYDQKLAAQDAQLAQYKTQLAAQTEMINKLLQFGELMVNKPAAPADPGIRRPQNNFNNTELGYDPALFADKHN